MRSDHKEIPARIAQDDESFLRHHFYVLRQTMHVFGTITFMPFASKDALFSLHNFYVFRVRGYRLFCAVAFMFFANVDVLLALSPPSGGNSVVAKLPYQQHHKTFDKKGIYNAVAVDTKDYHEV
jgi:hypothetical protein